MVYLTLIPMGFGKDGKGVIIRRQQTVVLLTLADQAALFIGSKLAIADDFRMLKTECFCTLRGGTAGDVGGLLFGLADADLTPAEVAAGIAANAPTDANDQVGSDLAERPSWLFGALVPDSSGTAGNFVGIDGSPMLVLKPRWTFGTTKSWAMFIYNNTGSALTTGASVDLIEKSFGVWIR